MLQTWAYFKRFPKDDYRIKYLVSVIDALALQIDHIYFQVAAVLFVCSLFFSDTFIALPYRAADLGHTVSIFHILWRNTVINFGDFPSIDIVPWYVCNSHSRYLFQFQFAQEFTSASHFFLLTSVVVHIILYS